MARNDKYFGVKQTISKVKNFIKHFDLNLFTRQAQDFHASDVASILERINDEQMLVAFEKIDATKKVRVFEYLDLLYQQKLLNRLNDTEKANILNNMSPDDRTTLLSSISGMNVTHLMTLLTSDERKEAQDLLGYPTKSVGRLMNPRYICVSPEMTVCEAQTYIYNKGIDSENINVVYVVNKENILLDDMPIRRLLLNKRSQKISEIMDNKFISLNINDNADTALNVFKQYDRVVLPVVSTKGICWG